MKTNKKFQLGAVFALVAGLGGAFAVSRQTATNPTMADVIVTFQDGPSTENLNRVEAAGGKLYRRLDLIQSAAFSIPKQNLSRIGNLPNVTAVTEEARVRQTMYDVTPAVGGTFAFNSGLTGRGVGVGIIDSGVSPHRDLTNASEQSRVIAREIFTPEIVSQDTYGHGTHVASILGGRGIQSSGPGYTKNFRGIAPDVNIVSFTALDRNGNGRESDVIAAIAKAIEYYQAGKIRVLNLSLGKPVRTSYLNDPLCQAVERAWKAGLVVVVSAGNEGRNNSMNTQGYGTISSPGNDPYVITVGALRPMGTASRADDLLASYSSKGPTLYDHIAKPDIVAPGNKVVSAMSQDGRMRNAYIDNSVKLNFYVSGGPDQWGDQYYWMSGTSMAAPVVAGAAAILLQRDPTLTPDQVKYRLMRTASKSFSQYYSTSTDPVTNQTYTVRHDLMGVGAGYLDIQAALSNTEKPTKPALSPVIVYNASSNKAMLSGSNLVWGDSVVPWNLVWGTNVVTGSNLVWGDNLLWGDRTVAGFSTVWTNNLVWGDKAPSGEADPLLLKGDQ